MHILAGRRLKLDFWILLRFACLLLHSQGNQRHETHEGSRGRGDVWAKRGARLTGFSLRLDDGEAPLKMQLGRIQAVPNSSRFQLRWTETSGKRFPLQR